MSHSSQVAKPSWGMTTKPSSEFLFFLLAIIQNPMSIFFLAHKNYKIFCWWWLYVPLKKQEKYWGKNWRIQLAIQGRGWSAQKSDPRSSRKRGPHCTAAPDCRIPGWDDPGKFGLLNPQKKKKSPEMDGSSTVQPTNNWRFMIGFSTSYELGTVCNWMHSDAPY